MEVKSTGPLSQSSLCPQPQDTGCATGLQPVPGGTGVSTEAKGGGGRSTEAGVAAGGGPADGRGG